MDLLDAASTAALLPYVELAHELEAVLRDTAVGKTHAPDRVTLDLAGHGTLLVMPATDQRLVITKLVTVHPANAQQSLPSVQGEVVVLAAETGQRLFMLEGATVTARRTAALSLLAARLLAPHPRGPLLIVGAGTQGRAHLEAFVAGFGIQQVYITSRTFAHAEALAAHARSLGVTADAVVATDAVLAETPLIVTATTSRTPVLPVQVRSDAFIAAVGSYQPGMIEIPAGLVRRAHVYVDTVRGAQAEAGDVIAAGVDWGLVKPLFQALDTPPQDGPVLFKSVGHALWDLAAARLAYRKRQS
jgi:ornithine cyclodeaminase